MPKQVLTTLYQFHEHPNKQAVVDWVNNNWHDLCDFEIGEIISSLEYRYSEAGIEELCEANEYYFNEDGEFVAD